MPTKTNDACATCSLSSALCICPSIPFLALSTRVTLVIHVNELKRSSNTGRLALKALANSAMRIRGERSGPLELSDLLSERYRTLLLYPAVDAVELNREFVAADRRPIQLIVPDGTWRQASKVLYRHPELIAVQRVRLPATDLPKFHLRAQNRPDRTATLPAIAHALGVIEGAFVREELLKVYDLRVDRGLLARGLLASGVRVALQTASENQVRRKV